jgi:uncharacterized protein YfaP (DUF2135 family)
MKKTFLLMCISAAFSTVASAQSFVETFDANSLGWTESAGESNSGTAVIDKGVMTIKSKGDSNKSKLGPSKARVMNWHSL